MTKATLRIYYVDAYSRTYFWELTLGSKIAAPIYSKMNYKSERSAVRGAERFAIGHNIVIERVVLLGGH